MAITLNEVKDIFSQVTRYPLELLDANARLEEDLGIDSVKLGEIFSVFREKYNIPMDLKAPRERLRTMQDITELLNEVAGAPQESVETSPVISAETSTIPGNQELHAHVTQVFAQVTRYPEELLEGNARLEEDLGIDSVKLGEILSVLREKYSLPAELVIPKEKLGSINNIADSLTEFMNSNSSAPLASTSVTKHPVVSDSPVSTPRAVKAPVSLPVSSDKPFAGKIVFISGSGHGIGKTMGMRLAQLGAHVILNSFHSRIQGEETAEEIRLAGGSSEHIWGSVANETHVNRIFDQIKETHGRLDFFISNASNGKIGALEDITVEDWEKGFATNIMGLHRSSMRAAELMKKNGGGKIITLSSPASKRYVDYFGCMGTIKAAVESLTRSLAVELNKYNIQVNCVSPGPVSGDLIEQWPEGKRLVKYWEECTPEGRLTAPEEVSDMVEYLLRDSTTFITGSVMVVDGGISAVGF